MRGCSEVREKKKQKQANSVKSGAKVEAARFEKFLLLSYEFVH